MIGRKRNSRKKMRSKSRRHRRDTLTSKTKKLWVSQLKNKKNKKVDLNGKHEMRNKKRRRQRAINKDC